MLYIFQKWVRLLSYHKVPFNYHQLLRGDSILIDFQRKKQIYIIIQGSLKLSKIFTNQEILTLGIFTENDIINELEHIVHNKNYYYIAETLTTTSIISCNYEKIAYWIYQDANICYEIILAYQKYTQKIILMMQVLAHRDKKSRLIHLLLLLCQQFGCKTKLGIVIPIIITQNTLATIIGSNRITITRIIQSLQKSQLISIYHHKMVIHNLISLSNYNKYSLRYKNKLNS